MTLLTHQLHWTFGLLCFLSFKFSIATELNSTTFGIYTNKEKIALKELRALVEPQLYNDFLRRDAFLVRWLRNQNFEIEKVKTKLLKSLQWRKEMKIDNISDKDFSVLKSLFPISLSSRDKFGRPVLLADIQKHSIRKLVLQGSVQDKQRYGIYILELSAREMARARNSVGDQILIVDMFGFNMKEHGCFQCVPIILSALTIYEDNYPEQTHKVYLFNVPKTFQVLLHVMRPLMSAHLQTALEIYGYDRTEWQPAVLKTIDANQLPRQFGGTKI